MISIVFGQKPKMALQGANLNPSENTLQSRRFWAQNDRGHAQITTQTILAMISQWFPSFLAKKPKWLSKGPIWTRLKTLSNRGDFTLKVTAGTRRYRLIEY